MASHRAPGWRNLVVWPLRNKWSHFHREVHSSRKVPHFAQHTATWIFSCLREPHQHYCYTDFLGRVRGAPLCNGQWTQLGNRIFILWSFEILDRLDLWEITYLHQPQKQKGDAVAKETKRSVRPWNALNKDISGKLGEMWLKCGANIYCFAQCTLWLNEMVTLREGDTGVPQVFS